MGLKRAVLATLIVAVSLTFAAPVAGQEQSDEPGLTVFDESDEAQPKTEVIRDDDTSDAVQRIRRNLLVVALLMSTGLVVYVWHTSPKRRLRIATHRAESGNDHDDATAGDKSVAGQVIDG